MVFVAPQVSLSGSTLFQPKLTGITSWQKLKNKSSEHIRRFLFIICIFILLMKIKKLNTIILDVIKKYRMNPLFSVATFFWLALQCVWHFMLASGSILFQFGDGKVSFMLIFQHFIAQMKYLVIWWGNSKEIKIHWNSCRTFGPAKAKSLPLLLFLLQSS